MIIVLKDIGLHVEIPDGVHKNAVITIEQNRPNLRIQANCQFQVFQELHSATSENGGSVEFSVEALGNTLVALPLLTQPLNIKGR